MLRVITLFTFISRYRRYGWIQDLMFSYYERFFKAGSWRDLLQYYLLSHKH